MTWWQYLILANLYLALFYGFYIFLLRKETFFQLNRVYLVASAVLSFLIPAIQADWVQNLFITQQVKQIIFNQPVVIYQYAAIVEDDSISIGQILAIIYTSGIVLLTGRFIWQLSVLNQLIKKPQAAAFSFFKKINVTGDLTDTDVIIAHEQVHAKQWHSADVLIMEAIMILNWFNPVVYFYRRAIKHIHEFIADNKVVHAGADKAGYAMLLLNHTMNLPSHNLANQFFNHSLLKQRIIMLQKNRSQRVRLIKYGLSAPLFALMLILTSATVNNSKTVETINTTAEKVFDVKASEAFALPVDMVKGMVIEDKTVTDTVPATNEIFTAVEQSPEFRGGMQAFSKFLAGNIRYPEALREAKTEGKVFISFVVEKDGSLSSFKNLRDIGNGSGEEAIRVLALSPKWKPGYQNGKAVRVQYNVPIEFNLKTAERDGENSELFTEVEQVPEFPGGIEAFNKFLSTNIRYPKVARDEKIQGRVFLQFVVENDGALADIKVLRGVSKSLDAEALRVIRLSPKWKPGVQNGRPVRVQYNVPIAFSLGGEKAGKNGVTKTTDVYKTFSSRADTPTFSIGVASAPKKGDVYHTFSTTSTDTPTFSIGVANPKDKRTFIITPGNTFKTGDNAAKTKIMLNGKEIDKATMDKLDPGTIANISVLKGTPAVTKHGDASNDVIEITTKTGSSATSADGALVIIDGKVSDAQTMKSLDAKEIEFVNVYKGDDAVSKYGVKGRDGVIVVTSKNKSGKSDINFFDSKSSLSDKATRPLILIDGKETSYEKLKTIDKNTIESIAVIKDSSAAVYGPKAKNGVLKITTKGKK
ncbi:MAG: TonB family protein [Sphingobacteriales bacterium]|nr:MAG: TonB family protein [Sphingobacteriales bacterium]